jgi:hypothetical protein
MRYSCAVQIAIETDRSVALNSKVMCSRAKGDRICVWHLAVNRRRTAHQRQLRLQVVAMCVQLPEDQYGFFCQKQLHAVLQIYFRAPLCRGEDAALLDIHSFLGLFPGPRGIQPFMVWGVAYVALGKTQARKWRLVTIRILRRCCSAVCECESNSNGEDERKERVGEFHSNPPSAKPSTVIDASISFRVSGIAMVFFLRPVPSDRSFLTFIRCGASSRRDL